MRPSEHFYASLAALEGRGKEDREWVVREFIRLTAPVLGAPLAEELCRRALDRTAKMGNPPGLQQIGALAAFLLGDYDDAVPLDDENWEDLRDTLEEASGEMDLNVLTSLMGALLSRGKLSER
jgi:hypothetical protein